MTYQLGNAKVWDGAAWVDAVGGAAVRPEFIERAGASATADVTSHVKGAWVELIASTAAEANLIFVQVYNVSVSGQATGTLLDLGVGATGSESVVAGNIAVGSATIASSQLTMFPLRINVPSGSRIAARIQGVRSLQTATIVVTTLTGDPAPSSVEVLGTDTATSRGTLCNTSTFTEIVGSSNAYREIVIINSMSANTVSNDAGISELAIGASGSELSVCKVPTQRSSVETIGMQIGTPYVVQVGPAVPAGTRLSAKSGVGSTDVCVIGVPA
jgi:hypothetical protein